METYFRLCISCRSMNSFCLPSTTRSSSSAANQRRHVYARECRELQRRLLAACTAGHSLRDDGDIMTTFSQALGWLQ